MENCPLGAREQLRIKLRRLCRIGTDAPDMYPECVNCPYRVVAPEPPPKPVPPPLKEWEWDDKDDYKKIYTKQYETMNDEYNKILKIANELYKEKYSYEKFINDDNF